MKHVHHGLVDNLLGHVSDTVHRVLILDHAFGGLAQIVLVDLELILAHQETAHELPLEIGGETGEILLHILCGDLAAIRDNQPALEERLGKLKTGLVHEIFADILVEPPLGLVLILRRKTLVHLLGDVLVGLLLLLFLVIFLEAFRHLVLLVG